MFWQIYLPVLAALVSSFVITTLFDIGMTYLVHKKQESARKEFETKVARGEIDPMTMLFGGAEVPAGLGGGLPTASGEGSANVPGNSHGQYL
jgi:hypothetical protein